MFAEIVQNCSFDPAEAEIVGVPLDFYWSKTQPVLAVRRGPGSGCPRGQLVDHRTARVTEREQSRDLVIGFAGRVVTSAAEAAVQESARGQVAIFTSGLDLIKQRVSPGNDQTDRRQFRCDSRDVRLQEYRVDMPFEMIHRDEWLTEFEGKDLAVRDADQQRADQSGPLRHADGVDFGEGKSRLRECFANDWNDLPQMLARGQLGNYPSIFAMDVHLRGDHDGQNVAAIGDDGCGGFVAGGFDSEDAYRH